jgi:hypothetical protein
MGTYSESRKRVYSSSPTLTELPPNCIAKPMSHLSKEKSNACSASDPRGDKPDKTYLRNENLVTSGNAHGKSLAVTVDGAGANGQNLGLVLLLDAALREEDTGGSLGLGLDALDEDTVQEGSEVLDVAEDRLIERRDHS